MAPCPTSNSLRTKTKILHIPTVMGAVVPAYNVPGVSGEIKFTPEALAGIYLGKITTWNDPALAKANPGLKLPNQPIIVDLPLRWQRNHLHLYRLSLQGEHKEDRQQRP